MRVGEIADVRRGTHRRRGVSFLKKRMPLANVLRTTVFDDASQD
jgi:hypothetical protein